MNSVCANSSLSNAEYLRQFHERTRLQRIPLSGSIDITHRCNLNCVHCYVGPRNALDGCAGREMATDLIMSVIDQITDAGCLNLLISGGEPLVRPDFEEIYRHIKSKGMLVTLFTNATLITEKSAALFAELPPQTIEISLYGASDDTSARITGVASSYDRCMRGINLLLEHGVKNVRLKTILMTLNRHEFYEIENIAKNLGMKFRFDACLFPRLNGDKTPLMLRVPPADAVEIEFSNSERARIMNDFFDKHKGLSESENLYVCGAGVTYFHIDPYGMLQPCMMTTNYKYDLAGGSFAEGWENEIKLITEKRASSFICNSCEKRVLCGTCPAFFSLENGSEEVHSDYLCKVGAKRFENIHKEALIGGIYGN